jgi:3-oxoacyl-[acyl-carrier protein] reductase
VLVHGASNQAGAAETAEQVRAAGRQTEIVMADISASDGRQKLLAQAAAWRPRIDAWIHCAGSDVLTGAAKELSFEGKLTKLWQVDVLGTIQLARAAAAQMQANLTPHASMVFVGWDQASEGMEGDAGQMFGPIKAAITSFAINLAQAVAPDIRVNVVAPGWIQTAWGTSTDDYWDRRAKQSALLNRWGTPEDVAAAIAFLTHSDASFITGQCWNINGGWNRKVTPPETD